MASASASGRRRACLARALDARGDEVWAGFSCLGCPSRTVGFGAVAVFRGT